MSVISNKNHEKWNVDELCGCQHVGEQTEKQASAFRQAGGLVPSPVHFWLVNTHKFTRAAPAARVKNPKPTVNYYLSVRQLRCVRAGNEYVRLFLDQVAIHVLS